MNFDLNKEQERYQHQIYLNPDKYTPNVPYQKMGYNRIFAIALIIAILSASSLIVDSIDANANKYKKKSLAVSQTNYCGQGDSGISVQCSNTVSQTQGNENGVALTDWRSINDVAIVLLSYT